MGFVTVPILTFGVLHCFCVTEHDRRRILHCNVSQPPTSAWTRGQLRETFPYDSGPGFLLIVFDRCANFSAEVIDTAKSFGIQPQRSSFRSR
jgi:putative transposase